MSGNNMVNERTREVEATLALLPVRSERDVRY